MNTATADYDDPDTRDRLTRASAVLDPTMDSLWDVEAISDDGDFTLSGCDLFAGITWVASVQASTYGITVTSRGGDCEMFLDRHDALATAVALLSALATPPAQYVLDILGVTAETLTGTPALTATPSERTTGGGVVHITVTGPHGDLGEVHEMDIQSFCAALLMAVVSCEDEDPDEHLDRLAERRGMSTDEMIALLRGQRI